MSTVSWSIVTPLLNVGRGGVTGDPEAIVLFLPLFIDVSATPFSLMTADDVFATESIMFSTESIEI